MPLSHSQGRARRELVVGASLKLVHLGSWVWYSHPVCDDSTSGKCEVLKIYNTEGFFQKRGLCKDTEMQESRMHFRHWKAFLMVRAQLLVTRGSATGIEMKGRQRPNDKELRDFDFLPVYEAYWMSLNRCVAPACDLGRSSQQHSGGQSGGVRMNKVIINNHHPAGLVSSTCPWWGGRGVLNGWSPGQLEGSLRHSASWNPHSCGKSLWPDLWCHSPFIFIFTHSQETSLTLGKSDSTQNILSNLFFTWVYKKLS